MKEAVVMSVDMGKSMQLPYSENMSRNSLAFQCVKLFLQNKLFNNSKNLFGLGLFGDNEENGRCYLIHPLSVPQLQVVREIAQLEELKVQNKLEGGDIFETIKFSIDSIQEQIIGKKKLRKRVFVFTSGEGESDYQRDQLKMLSDYIQQTGAKVNIIVVDFMEGYDEEKNEIDGLVPVKPQQQKNSQLLMKLKDLCPDNVRIVPASVAIDLYREFENKETNRIPVYRGPLEITPGLKIEILTYSHTRKDKPASFKNYNLKAKQSSSDKEALVHTEAIYQIEGQDKAAVIDSEDIITGYKYGDGVVPITELIKEQMKIAEFKTMQLVGFVDKDCVPRHYFLGNIYKVLPNQDLISQKMFSTILYSMLSLGRYAICRHIARNMKNGANPKLIVLIPYKSSKGECFYMTDIPTAQDIREFHFNPLKQSTEEEQKLVDELMDKMNLMNLDEDEEEAVEVNNLHNPVKQYLYQSIFHKIAHPDSTDLPPLDPVIKDSVTPEIAIFQKTSDLMKDIKVKFGFKNNEIKKDKDQKKIVWSELIKEREKEMDQESTVAESEQQVYWKKFSFEPEHITSIDPESPIESFNSMISYQKKDLVGKAISEMCSYIQNKFSTNNSRVVADCLSTLRKGCVKEKEQEKWDEWIAEKVYSLGPDFASILKDKGLGYILRSNEDLFKVEDGVLHHDILKIQYDDLD